MAKLGLGIFSFTCDEGCSMQVLEALNQTHKKWMDKVDFVDFRLIKTPPKKPVKIDVAFVEGAIATEEDVERIKKIRKNARMLVAMGSCAIIGAPSNHRNFFDNNTKKKINPFLKKFKHRKMVQPLKDFVKVDEEITGCPIDESDFISLVEKYILNKGAKHA